MKKGFTLIELLTVIIIISIITAISIPMIMSTVERANKSTTLESVRELVKIATADVVNKKYDVPYQYKIEDHVLDYQRGNFKSGLIVITSGNHSFVENLSTNRHCINGSLDQLKITSGDCKTSDYEDYRSNQMIRERYTVQDDLDNVDGLYFDEFTEEYYFKGNVTNNYVSYAGRMWRIVSFHNKKIKLISQSVLEEAGSKSYMDTLTYLEHTFYQDLSPRNYVLKDEYRTGNVSSIGSVDQMIAAESTSMTKRYVGLLSVSEYQRATGLSGNFMGQGTSWLLTRKNLSTGYYLSSGQIIETSLTAPYTIRPVIVLNETMVYSGNGTLDDPYLAK